MRLRPRYRAGLLVILLLGLYLRLVLCPGLRGHYRGNIVPYFVASSYLVVEGNVSSKTF